MSNAKTHIIVILAMIFWGMSFIWSKIVFETYDQITTIFFRLIISVVALFLFMTIAGIRIRIDKKDLKYFVVSSFFNPFLYFIGENYGLKEVSAFFTSVIISTIPVITPFFVFLFYKERITRLNIFGLMISFIGVLIIIFSDGITTGSGNLFGFLMLGLAVISAIFYTIYVKKLSFKYNPVTIIAWQNLIGIFLFLPLFLAFSAKEALSITPDKKAIFSLIMLGIFASSAAFIFYTYGIKKLGIIKTNFYTNLIPAFSFLFAYLFLGEPLTLLKFTGLIIVVTGIVFSEMKKGKVINE
jgi:drug/metabolite transporter (DMT)-like permease